jgi:PAS domain S-box-containing protein
MEEITGFTMEEINQHGWYQSVYPDPEVQERAIARMQRMRVGHNLEAEEWTITRKDGQERTIAISTSVIVGHGQEAHVLAVMRDLTDQKRQKQERETLEAHMRHVQKLESLGVLAGGIAHDFNNLLTGILGNAELARHEMPLGSAAVVYLHDVEDIARRAADLCRQMLAYSGRGQFVVEPLSLNSVVREMGRMLAVSVSKKATLSYDLSPELPALTADANQIRQLVMNLITNASEALENQSGAIVIRTDVATFDREYLKNTYLDDQLPEGRYVYLEVTDTGCGMSPEDQQRMFEPFFTTKFTGRGLGMAAVLGIMRGHRGAIKVDSKRGQGTTITLLFPAAEATLPEQPMNTVSSQAYWKGQGTVLVVDDEEPVRTVAQRLLERLGFRAIVASDGHQALELFRAHHQDLICVLLDLTMPRLDGPEAFRQMRQQGPKVPILLTSGYTQQHAATAFGDEQPAGFVQKPLDLQKLRDSLRRIGDDAGKD